MTEPLAFHVVLSDPYDVALDKVVAALKEKGFGVITRIDVQATLKEKLGQEFRRYDILGACNPPLAHRALESDPQVGLLLPCNVTLDERAEGVHVSIGNPEALLGAAPLADDPALKEVAAAARAKLEQVAEALL